MRLRIVLFAMGMLCAAAPASAADFSGEGPGWRNHHRHGGYHHGQRRWHHGGRFQAEEVIQVVEYREPYLPRGILYNAPPLPVSYGAARGEYESVISAKY